MVRNLVRLGKIIRSARKQQLGRRMVHKVSFACEEEEIELDNDKKKSSETKKIEECMWVPHHRTGIYFPKGHDWVMEDVPATAGSQAPTYWLRTVDGVDSVHVDHDVDRD